MAQPGSTRVPVVRRHTACALGLQTLFDRGCSLSLSRRPDPCLAVWHSLSIIVPRESPYCAGLRHAAFFKLRRTSIKYLTRLAPMPDSLPPFRLLI